jgi:hypothetical protein
VTQALLSGHLRNTPIDWDGIVLPAAMPNNAAGLADWWRDSGIVMIQRWHRVIKVDRDAAHAHVRSSRALKMEELGTLMDHVIWPQWCAAVNDRDLITARGIHELDGYPNRLLARALYCFGEGSSPTPRADDHIGQSFQSYLSKCQELQEAELERKYRASFPREAVRDGLGATLRPLLCEFTAL